MFKKYKFLIIVCALGMLTLVPAFSKYQDLAKRDKNIELRMKQILSENRNLANRQYRLQTDPVFAESVARHKLNVAKEDEVIYKVIPEKE
ncbi:MAG: septum formation initiator family protein [Candidatus Omnitrophica bacterium]|nr:septum formation initiator family protein [Candidatus Omnitrophota bacterium]